MDEIIKQANYEMAYTLYTAGEFDAYKQIRDYLVEQCQKHGLFLTLAQIQFCLAYNMRYNNGNYIPTFYGIANISDESAQTLIKRWVS